MRIIIAGGRDFYNFELLDSEVSTTIQNLKTESFNTSKDSIEIVSGEAKGADKLGEQFANKYNLQVKSFPAKWNDLDTTPCRIATNAYGKYNALAGHNRNEEMAKYASQDDEIGVLIAFWNGKSTGTKNMIKLSKKYNLRTFIIKY
jgi:hypothetical protein